MIESLCWVLVEVVRVACIRRVLRMACCSSTDRMLVAWLEVGMLVVNCSHFACRMPWDRRTAGDSLVDFEPLLNRSASHVCLRRSSQYLTCLRPHDR
jgi:hypothetical protein